MRRVAGIMLVAVTGLATLSGCALRDPRDTFAYSGASQGLWDSSFEIIDWNFPSTANQPPIEAPKRLRPERTAIGTTWVTRNPLPLSDPQPSPQPVQSPALDAPQAPGASNADGGNISGLPPVATSAGLEPAFAAAELQGGAR